MLTIAAGPTADPDPALREQLSNQQSLLVLSMLMTESGDEEQILHLAATSVPSFGCCRGLGVYLDTGRWCSTAPTCSSARTRAAIEAQLGILGSGGGALVVPDQAWGWAYPLRGREGHLGSLIVSAAEEPPAAD